MNTLASKLALTLLATTLASLSTPATARTMADVLAASKPGDWRALDPANMVYIDLPGGRVVMELAAQFAPKHAENIRTLVREGYFDGLAINRSQDNFVVQWGDPDGKKPLGSGRKTLAPEFTRPASGLAFVRLPDPDTFAAEVGFVDGFPAARESERGQAWLVHCYAMVGAGRDNAVDSGGGTELYVVTGHSPRQLDRNITLVGRIVQGMEHLSTIPRGSAPLGFFEKPEQRVPLKRVRLGSEVPANERVTLEALRTDTQTFTDLIEARRNRRDEWYKVPAGRIDVCNVPLVVRAR